MTVSAACETETCLSEPNPFPLLDHKQRCSPGMHQYSTTLHILQKWLYIHNHWKLHCQICRWFCNPQPTVCPQRHWHVLLRVGESIHRMVHWQLELNKHKHTHTHKTTTTTNKQTNETPQKQQHLKQWNLVTNQFVRTCRSLSVNKPSTKLGNTSIWVFTLTANSAGVYMLKLCAPGPRRVSTFSGDSEHVALVQTYCCCSVVLPLKAWLDMA